MDKQDGKLPPGKSQEAGRTKILEAARSLFRSKIRHEISRQEIARSAGVVPGLMTYHFASNRDLVFAAVEPVLAEAISKLFVAIESSATLEDRFEQVIVLFLDFAERDAPLLDIFLEYATATSDENAQALIGSTVDKLGRFFAQAVDAGLIARDTNPRFLLLALWGMCRLVAGAQPVPLIVLDADVPPSRKRQQEADLILNLVLRGVGRPRDP